MSDVVQLLEKTWEFCFDTKKTAIQVGPHCEVPLPPSLDSNQSKYFSLKLFL